MDGLGDKYSFLLGWGSCYVADKQGWVRLVVLFLVSRLAGFYLLSFRIDKGAALLWGSSKVHEDTCQTRDGAWGWLLNALMTPLASIPAPWLCNSWSNLTVLCMIKDWLCIKYLTHTSTIFKCFLSSTKHCFAPLSLMQISKDLRWSHTARTFNKDSFHSSGLPGALLSTVQTSWDSPFRGWNVPFRFKRENSRWHKFFHLIPIGMHTHLWA